MKYTRSSLLSFISCSFTFFNIFVFFPLTSPVPLLQIFSFVCPFWPHLLPPLQFFSSSGQVSPVPRPSSPVPTFFHFRLLPSWPRSVHPPFCQPHHLAQVILRGDSPHQSVPCRPTTTFPFFFLQQFALNCIKHKLHILFL